MAIAMIVDRYIAPEKLPLGYVVRRSGPYGFLDLPLAWIHPLRGLRRHKELHRNPMPCLR